jgi:hypothetical protein
MCWGRVHHLLFPAALHLNSSNIWSQVPRSTSSSRRHGLLLQQQQGRCMCCTVLLLLLLLLPCPGRGPWHLLQEQQ